MLLFCFPLVDSVELYATLQLLFGTSSWFPEIFKNNDNKKKEENRDKYRFHERNVNNSYSVCTSSVQQVLRFSDFLSNFLTPI